MKNYVEQNDCINCCNLFCKEEYDESPEFYCDVKHDRPKCMSSFMEYESTNYTDSKEVIRKAHDDWDDWSEDHQVRLNGKCDDYKEKNDKN